VQLGDLIGGLSIQGTQHGAVGAHEVSDGITFA
jgi:hypothetical protein